MSLQPWINWQFHKTQNLIDQRSILVRGSPGTTVNRLGLISNVKSNNSRYFFTPANQLEKGLLIEQQRTNLLLRSEELNNASWTVNNISVATNTAVSPDGTSNAETITVSNTAGVLSQAVTITANNAVASSIFVKSSGASDYFYMQLSSETTGDKVESWYNVSNGTVGGNTAGSGNCVFRQKTIEDYGNSWYRCSLITTTTFNTSYRLSFAPCDGDGILPTTNDNCFAWGTQVESSGTVTWPTSYIPTVASQVTRNADNFYIPVTSSQVPLDRGTLIFEWTENVFPSWTMPSNLVMGGIGDTFNNTIYIVVLQASIAVIYRTGGVGVGGAFTLSIGSTRVQGGTFKLAVSWYPGRIAACVNGGSISTLTTATILPFASVARIAVGMNPWDTNTSSNCSNVIHRSFMYIPDTVADSVLQTMTIPS